MPPFHAQNGSEGQEGEALVMRRILALAFALALCAGAWVPCAYADGVLTMDQSTMTIEVGQTAERSYSLSVDAAIVNANGQSTTAPYDISVESSDPNIARGQAADGVVLVHGYSGGEVQLTVDVLHPNGGSAGQATFAVIVEGEDTTLDQAIVVVGDEEEAAALEELDRRNGVEPGIGASTGASGASGADADSDSAAKPNSGEADQGGVPVPAVAGIVVVAVALASYALARKRKRGSGHGSKATDSATKCMLAVLVAFGAAAGPIALPQVAWGYFDRGPVGVDIGQYEVVLDEGQSTTIMCIITPEFDDQLPGCGMAECPQTCGDGCLDGNGQCTCVGAEYMRWFTAVSVMSTNPSVARASYGGGALIVSGYGPGEVTLTVSASLRQFQDNEASVHVVVNALPEQNGDDEVIHNNEADNRDNPDSRSNVVNGTGEGDGNLGTGEGDGAGYDKPGAADSAGNAPEAPEVPVEPDVSQPVVLYEIEEVDSAEEDSRTMIDPGAAGATGAAACACLAIGMAGTGGSWRRERS